MLYRGESALANFFNSYSEASVGSPKFRRDRPPLVLFELLEFGFVTFDLLPALAIVGTNKIKLRRRLIEVYPISGRKRKSGHSDFSREFHVDRMRKWALGLVGPRAIESLSTQCKGISGDVISI